MITPNISTLAVTGLILGGIIWILRTFLLGEWRKRESVRRLEGRPRLSEAQVRELAAQYGRNSNSFLTLYPGFRYFTSRDPSIVGAIAFLNLPHAWVGATEPLAEPEQALRLLKEFCDEARACGKAAMLLPVNAELAASARQFGFGRLMIGGEPGFSLPHYDPRLDRVHSARALQGRGAQVLEVRPDQLSARRRGELDEITAEWLSTRRMTPLSFLNKVAPWEHSADKKYFVVERSDRVLAFLAAIPIWPRKGWYLIDLLRRSDAPPGATELLVLESMRLLKEQGALTVSLGVAPLSELESASREDHPLLYPLLQFAYERGNLFYRFKPLHQFKLKFGPTRTEPAFLIYNPPSIGLYGTLSLLEAFLPGGIVQATYSGVRKMFFRSNWGDWFRGQISPRVVTRSIPSRGQELLRRTWLTVALLLAQIGCFFVTSDGDGHLRSEVAARWFYSWEVLRSGEGWRLFSSAFLHWNLFHLQLNVVTLVFFCGTLEVLGGVGLMAGAYALGALFSNPLATLLFVSPAQWIRPELWERFAAAPDVGASLGIFASAGGLCWFLRGGRMLFAGLSLLTIVISITMRDPQAMNHLVALAIGAGWVRFRLGK